MTAPAAMVGSIELAVIRTDPAVGSVGVVVDVCTFAVGLATLVGAIPLVALVGIDASGPEGAPGPHAAKRLTRSASTARRK